MFLFDTSRKKQAISQLREKKNVCLVCMQKKSKWTVIVFCVGVYLKKVSVPSASVAVDQPHSLTEKIPDMFSVVFVELQV